jgi:hypothetical protein
VIAGFRRSQRKGYPTDAYIRALLSEKGAEAPLSICLQYYAFLRATSLWSFWSMACSLPLSVYSISKFVYVNFELDLASSIAPEDASLLNADAQNLPPRGAESHPPGPPASHIGAGITDSCPPRLGHGPPHPPGVAPHPSPPRPPGIAPPPGVALPKAAALPPIMLGNERVNDRE